MKYTTIRTKTVESLRQFYQEALNPRYCIHGIYHIKVTNWFPTSHSPSINKAVENTLNAMFERITPVEYKSKGKALTFNDFMTEYTKQHITLAEIKSEKYKKKKAKDNMLPAIPPKETEEAKEVYEDLSDMKEKDTICSLLTQTNEYLKRLVEIQEENRTVQKHCVENTTAHNLKVFQRLVNIEQMLNDYLK